MTTTEKARLLAMIAHDGQFRRDGVTPYFTHPEAVAAMVEERLKPIAYLHDVLEDTKVKSFQLQAWFGGRIAIAVSILTRWDSEKYDDYMHGVLSHKDCITVKIADMKHNLSCEPSENSKAKIAKWLPVLEASLKS